MRPSMVVAASSIAVGQFLGVLFGAVAVKILAVMGGVAGVGLYSVFRQLQQVLSSVGAVGGYNAVVWGVSEDLKEARDRYFISAFYSIFSTSFLVCITVFLLAELVSEFSLAGEYVTSVRWLIVPIFFGAILLFLRGVLTAHLQYSAIAIINILAGLGAALVAMPAGFLFINGYPEGGVLLVTASVVPSALYSFFKVRQLGYLKSWEQLSLRYVNQLAVSNFWRIALPNLFSLILTLGCLLLIRAQVVHSYGFEGAGILDAAWSISAMSVAVLLSSMQGYLLPVLTKSESTQDFQCVFSKAVRLALVFSVPILVLLILCKFFLVKLLFSASFIDAVDVLKWFFLGDFFKLIGGILSTTVTAKKDMKSFFVAEALWAFLFSILGCVFLSFGLEWLGCAYLFSYLIYFLFLSFRLFFVHKVKFGCRCFFGLFFSFLLLLLVSIFSWYESVGFYWFFVSILAAFLLSYIFMRADERRFMFHLIYKTCGTLMFWKKVV